VGRPRPSNPTFSLTRCREWASRCPLFHGSLLTSHFSLLTSHFSLLTSHFSLDTSYSALVTSHSSLLTRHLSSAPHAIRREVGRPRPSNPTFSLTRCREWASLCPHFHGSRITSHPPLLTRHFSLANRRPPTAHRPPPTADRRPPTARWIRRSRKISKVLLELKGCALS
jgi:hypothetical protein